jgi:hypothetical protein
MRRSVDKLMKAAVAKRYFLKIENLTSKTTEKII